MPTVAQDRQTTIDLVKAAHKAELAGDYKEAYNLHTRAGNLLGSVIENGTKKSWERRYDKLRLRSSTERRGVLRLAAEGTGPPPSRPLPSWDTIHRERADPSGAIQLSLVEAGTWESLARAVVFHESVLDENGLPFLTPMLSPTLPDIEYHVYVETVRRGRFVWLYFHIKDGSKTQTMYTAVTGNFPRLQITSCSMSRASAYHEPCAKVQIGRVNPNLPGGTVHVGRPITITTGLNTTVVDKPDQVERKWAPRRFTYGKRRFVWRGNSKLLTQETLYEVKSETPGTGDRAMKTENEIFARPIAWLRFKLGMEKVATIGMVGGLDQLFQEFILADAVTRTMIGVYGDM
ncbi:hypothetical protein B0H34DRAFT_679996 [Crassisporium funariophilum]|nr:hypothetical protein B0H34DRAFT_679996 [Crassisporium funariophilum]